MNVLTIKFNNFSIWFFPIKLRTFIFSLKGSTLWLFVVKLPMSLLLCLRANIKSNEGYLNISTATANLIIQTAIKWLGMRSVYVYSMYDSVYEGNGTPLQYSCLENPMEGGAWKAAVHGVAKSDMTERLHFHFHALEKAMATHSSVLAWRIPGMGEPGGLPSVGSHRVGHDWSDLAIAIYPLTQEFFLGCYHIKNILT